MVKKKKKAVLQKGWPLISEATESTHLTLHGGGSVLAGHFDGYLRTGERLQLSFAANLALVISFKGRKTSASLDAHLRPYHAMA